MTEKRDASADELRKSRKDGYYVATDVIDMDAVSIDAATIKTEPWVAYGRFAVNGGTRYTFVQLNSPSIVYGQPVTLSITVGDAEGHEHLTDYLDSLFDAEGGVVRVSPDQLVHVFKIASGDGQSPAAMNDLKHGLNNQMVLYGTKKEA